MFYTILFLVVFIGTLVGIYIYKYFDSDSYFLKKCNNIHEGMTKETVISIMGNKFSYSKNEDGSEKLEWRKIRNTRVSNNGTIKSRPTLFGEKAKISGNSTVANGYTISFCVYISDNIVTSFTTSTENN